jgi:hypothetical protein
MGSPDEALAESGKVTSPFKKGMREFKKKDQSFLQVLTDHVLGRIKSQKAKRRAR